MLWAIEKFGVKWCLISFAALSGTSRIPACSAQAGISLNHPAFCGVWLVKCGLWDCYLLRVDVNSLPHPRLKNLADAPGEASVLVLVQLLRRKGDSRSWGQHKPPAIRNFGSSRSAIVFAIRFALSPLPHRSPLG